MSLLDNIDSCLTREMWNRHGCNRIHVQIIAADTTVHNKSTFNKCNDVNILLKKFKCVFVDEGGDEQRMNRTQTP